MTSSPIKSYSPNIPVDGNLNKLVNILSITTGSSFSSIAFLATNSSKKQPILLAINPGVSLHLTIVLPKVLLKNSVSKITIVKAVELC